MALRVVVEVEVGVVSCSSRWRGIVFHMAAVAVFGISISIQRVVAVPALCKTS